ncbi:MAG: hypothetical protein HY293_03765 [Planctomycetes bacterium]|nr:hypothetical protein [Planctomycetota bacterium]
MRPRAILVLLLLPSACAAPQPAASGAALPAAYYRLIDEAAEQLSTTLDAEGIRTNTGAILAGAVLYRKSGDRRRLDLALHAGDLLAAESEAGRMTEWLNHRWLLAPWIDAWRLLGAELGDERRARWRKEIEKNLREAATDVAARQDYPRFQSPFIRTSPNHLSIWASTVHLGGKVFGNAEWEALGGRVMHRFAAQEQMPDGTWGEHSSAGPTTGYNYLTTTSVALYAEHSGDPDAVAALRRALDFHAHFTWPDGTPVEVVNDRNRHGGVDAWGHFGFSRFPDGRRYAEFLTRLLGSKPPRGEALSRLAQNALYWHEGPSAPIPHDLDAWVYPMKVPASMRKSGPWWIGLSALIATQAPRNQFYLDRQGHLSLYHQKTGLIVNGANSKRQPELATFSEKIQGQTYHLPISSALDLSGPADRLSLAYNSFWADLRLRAASPSRIEIAVEITEQGRVEEAQLSLQLVVKAGEALETGKGRVTASAERVDVEDVAGFVRHHGWKLSVDAPARLAWPVFPFNPYSNGPETSLERAVATLSIPLHPAAKGGPFKTQKIALVLEIE